MPHSLSRSRRCRGRQGPRTSWTTARPGYPTIRSFRSVGRCGCTRGRHPPPRRRLCACNRPRISLTHFSNHNPIRHDLPPGDRRPSRKTSGGENDPDTAAMANLDPWLNELLMVSRASPLADRRKPELAPELRFVPLQPVTRNWAGICWTTACNTLAPLAVQTVTVTFWPGLVAWTALMSPVSW